MKIQCSFRGRVIQSFLKWDIFLYLPFFSGDMGYFSKSFKGYVVFPTA